MKEKTKKIKDDEIARLASMFQKEYGSILAGVWNESNARRGFPAIYDSGDCRGEFVAIIKNWIVEMDRE